MGGWGSENGRKICKLQPSPTFPPKSLSYEIGLPIICWCHFANEFFSSGYWVPLMVFTPSRSLSIISVHYWRPCCCDSYTFLIPPPFVQQPSRGHTLLFSDTPFSASQSSRTPVPSILIP